MCFASPSAPAAAPAPVVSPPPPPPAKDPAAPIIDPTKKTRDAAQAQAQGTAIFRNDLNLPTGSGSGTGNGLNLT